MSYITQRGLVLIKKYNLEENLEEIRNELTVRPMVNNMYDKNVSFEVFLENANKMYIPLWYGLNKLTKESNIDINGFENRIPDGDSIYCTFNGGLRDQQKEPINVALNALNDPNKRGGILQLPTGFGKTCLAIYLACLMGKKTIIIVNKEFLLKQWEDRIRTFAPTARIGKIQQNVFDIKNKDMVLAMVQTLSYRNYPINAFESFGFMITDEVHNLGAEVFSKCLFKIGCKYRIGLSATPERPDGLSKVFKWHIGEIIYAKEFKRSGLEPKVRIYKYNNKEAKEIENVKGDPNIPVMLTNIGENKVRNRFIINILESLVKKDRNILVLSERVAHLKILNTMYNSLEIAKEKPGGLFIGESTQTERDDISENANVLFGSIRLIQEGFDQPKLNTLVYALFNGGPMRNRPETKKVMKQTTGRIFRKAHTEICPLIIDIHDSYSVFKNQGYRRSAYYKDEKIETSIYKVIQTQETYTIDKQKKEKETKNTSFANLDKFLII